MEHRFQLAFRQPRTRRLDSSKRGLSLVELLVSIALFGLGALAAITMQRVGVYQSNRTDTRQSATELAKNLLEQTKVLTYSTTSVDPSLAATVGYADPPSAMSDSNPLNAEGQGSGTGRIFTRQWNIQDNTPLTDLKTISVAVSWTQNGVIQSIVLSTLKARDN